MRIAIIGRSELLYETAQLLFKSGHDIALIITAKAAPEYLFNEEDFRAFAEKTGAVYMFSNKLSHPDDIKTISDIGHLDIGVSANYMSLIPQEVIDLFKYGILNAHAGDLPRYKGNACQAWAIINGEDKIGLCIHKMMGGKLDEGDILERLYLPLTTETKVGDCLYWMREKIPLLFKSSLEKIANNPNYCLEKISEYKYPPLRCFPRKPEDGRINWNNSAHHILRLINGSNKPFHGAFCYFENEEVRIWDASVFEMNEEFLAIPGQVCLIDKSENYIVIACLKSMLKITYVNFRDQDLNPTVFIRSLRTRLT